MKKRILVAPLNWGIGHATRCIPMINALITEGFEPIIASDGQALDLLKKEFETLTFITLPGYNIRYSKTKKGFKWLLLLQLPKIAKAIWTENRALKKIIKTHQVDGVVSDNRLGMFSTKIPSVFITHQLNVLTGSTTKISTLLHDYYLNKFNECWIPDFDNNNNLSGKLSRNFRNKSVTTKYIGALSRFRKRQLETEFDILVLLSGPEPQRTLLEHKLTSELSNFSGNIALVRGIIETTQTISRKVPFTFYNFMQSKELERTINSSQLVISRSGYTTIMDLAKLGKQAFFIPTPGQFEQEYLAEYLDNKSVIASCNQDDFEINKLKKTVDYSGFEGFENIIDYAELFSLF